LPRPAIVHLFYGVEPVFFRAIQTASAPDPEIVGESGNDIVVMVFRYPSYRNDWHHEIVVHERQNISREKWFPVFPSLAVRTLKPDVLSADIQ
jgi:hypothetical protein